MMLVALLQRTNERAEISNFFELLLDSDRHKNLNCNLHHISCHSITHCPLLRLSLSLFLSLLHKRCPHPRVPTTYTITLLILLTFTLFLSQAHLPNTPILIPSFSITLSHTLSLTKSRCYKDFTT